jgi:hypothetical protein
VAAAIAAISLATVFASPALASSSVIEAAASPAGAQPDPGPVPTCDSSAYCDYSSLNPVVICFQAIGNIMNWSTQGSGCRNRDVQLLNQTADAVRLYFAPDFEGAWICIPAHDGVTFGTNTPVFNNGTDLAAGFGQHVRNNVASSKQATSDNCTNPT